LSPLVILGGGRRQEQAEANGSHYQRRDESGKDGKSELVSQ
jgi:hypothetical protein